MRINKLIPWWIKIPLKICIARIPLGHNFWNKVGVFVHGGMMKPDYAYSVFEKHYRAVKPSNGFTCLELGPGDSIFSAIISPAFGGETTYLVDSGFFAKFHPNAYREMGSFLQQKLLQSPDITGARSLAEVLTKCSASYLTDGLSSLRSIPNKSVNFIFSQAVLEHVKDKEFFETLKELRRIIKDDGACSHAIDLKDHLDLALNNLRFSKGTWESNLFSHSGFYTNRIRYKAMLEMFREAGFNFEVTDTVRWEKVPTPRSRMSVEFRSLSDEDLCVASFFVVLRPR